MNSSHNTNHGYTRVEEPLKGKVAAAPLTDTHEPPEPRGRLAGLSPGTQRPSEPEGPTPPRESLRWSPSDHPLTAPPSTPGVQRELRPDCRPGRGWGGFPLPPGPPPRTHLAGPRSHRPGHGLSPSRHGGGANHRADQSRACLADGRDGR